MAPVQFPERVRGWSKKTKIVAIAVVGVAGGIVTIVAALGVLWDAGTTATKPFRDHSTHPRPRVPPPLTLTATHDRGVLADGWMVVVPDRGRARSAFASGVHDCESLWQAAQAVGAADVGTSYIRVAAEGSGPRTSTILGIRARIVHRYPRLVGALADCPGGGAVGVIHMRIPLYAPDPVALRVAQIHHEAEGKVVGPYFEDREITVRHGESVPILIEGPERGGYVQWKLEITAIVNGRRRVYVLDDRGHPFRTTAPGSLDLAHPDYEWNWGRPGHERLEVHPHCPCLGY